MLVGVAHGGPYDFWVCLVNGSELRGESFEEESGCSIKFHSIQAASVFPKERLTNVLVQVLESSLEIKPRKCSPCKWNLLTALGHPGDWT